MIRYVVGFCFKNDASHVLLIAKQRPAWQSGMLNGIGGKVENGETDVQAMVREFHEEAGVETGTGDWQLFAQLPFPGGLVSFYRLFNDTVFHAFVQTTVEHVVPVAIDMLPKLPTIPNLQYLIPMAVHADSALSGSKLVLPVILQEQA